MGALAERDWSDFHGDTFELHTALDWLNTNMTTVIDSLAPLKVTHTKGFDPWMDSGLMQLLTSIGLVNHQYAADVLCCHNNLRGPSYRSTLLLGRAF